MSLVEWFRQLSAPQTGLEALKWISEHPALLWPERWPEIERWIAGRPPETREGLNGRFAAIRGLGEMLESSPSQWPENGPIETLAASVKDGERTLQQALAVAKAVDTVEALCPTYVRVVAGRTKDSALDGNWQDAVSTFRLLLEAIDALKPGPGTDEMRWFAVYDWIECAGMACHSVPDGRLFTDALKRGEALATAEERASRNERAANVRHRLGVLHLDPYLAGRTSQNLENQIRMWRQRFADLYGTTLAADPVTAMPALADAVETAVGFFEQALVHQQREARGLTLKAAAEAVMWRGVTGGVPDPIRVARYATEALALLPAERFPTEVAVLNRLLEYAEQKQAEQSADGAPEPDAAGESKVVTVTKNTPLLWLEPDEVVAQFGEMLAIERYLWRAREASKSDPDITVGLLLRVWPLLGDPDQESLRRNVVRELMSAFVGMFGISRHLRENGDDLERTQAALMETANRNRWTAGQFAAALAGLASATTGLNRETEGLPILAHAIDIATKVNAPLAAPMRIMHAEFMLGVAVNAYQAGAFPEAIKQYVASVQSYADEGLIEAATEALARTEDVTFEKPGQSIVPLAVGLADHAPRLATAGSPRLNERLQALWNRVIGRTLSEQPINLVLIWMQLQAAKGAIFATMLDRTDWYDWRRDEAASAMLVRLDHWRSTLPASLPGDDAASDPLDDEYVLVSHVGARSNPKSDDPVSNLEQRLDSHILRRMTDGVGALKAILSVDELRDGMKPRSALLSQFAGRMEDGTAALITMGLTTESDFGAIGQLQIPSATIVMGSGTATLEMGWFGPLVADLRRSLQLEPGAAVAAAKATDLLAADQDNLLGGGVKQHLLELRRQGKDHLCIHAHGPLHFHPQHLIGSDGEILADDWIVTYVPHPALLREPAPSTAAVTHEVVSMGIDFVNFEPHDLPPLPAAAQEAEAIAAIFEAPCWTNSLATKPRFVEALLSSRRLHLATHGSQNSSAPIFQCLYLWPDSSSDGIFRAYEVVGLDLSHLDLVTLSACETSLGRFDVSDTLRGLSALLFSAGVATIVSTLWAVEDNSARLFFETFYGALKDGSGKLDAFRTAQIETRRKFPAYRDWGAFQYSGRW